jgi:hypothetical protein
MRRYSTTVTGTGVSAPFIPDYMLSIVNIGVGCSISATAAYTVEHTFDDVFAPGFNPATATWFPNSGITAATGNKDGNYAFPICAIRLNVASSTGSVTMVLLQASGP